MDHEHTGTGIDPVSWGNFVQWLNDRRTHFEKLLGEPYRPVIPHEDVMQFWLEHTKNDPAAAKAFREVWHNKPEPYGDTKKPPSREG